MSRLISSKLVASVLAVVVTLAVMYSAGAQSQKRSVKVLGLSVEGNETTDANMIRLSRSRLRISSR